MPKIIDMQVVKREEVNIKPVASHYTRGFAPLKFKTYYRLPDNRVLVITQVEDQVKNISNTSKSKRTKNIFKFFSYIKNLL